MEIYKVMKKQYQGLNGGTVCPNMKMFQHIQIIESFAMSEYGGIATHVIGRSTITGLYAAGDAAYVGPSQLIYAASDGYKTAVTDNTDLSDEIFA